jgi:hypothetical protein
MKFIVNVALNGQHYCRIILPDSSRAVAIAKAKTIALSFGKGYAVTLSGETTTGEFIDIP